jgi:hypothetical protein
MKMIKKNCKHLKILFYKNRSQTLIKKIFLVLLKLNKFYTIHSLIIINNL